MTSSGSTNAPIRVLVLKANDYPVAGAVRLVEMYLAHLDRSRVEPVLCHVVSEERAPTLTQVSPRCADMESHDIVWRGIRRVRSSAAELRKIVRDTGVDIVTSNDLRTDFVCRMAGAQQGMGVPWSAFVHGWIGWKRKWGDIRYGFHESVDRWSVRKANEIWTGSHNCANDVRRYLQKSVPIKVLVNAAEPYYLQTTDEEVAQLRASLNLPPNTLLVGTLARMAWAKGHALLAEAVVKSGCDNLVAVLMGYGEEMEKLQAMAKEPKYRGRVILPGKEASLNQMPTYLKALDIFCFPSLQESLPVAVLEAMYMDNAIATSAAGDLPRVLGDGDYGMLFPIGDVDKMAECLRRYATDEELRATMASKAKERMLSYYSAPRYSKDLENAWVSLVERTRGQDPRQADRSTPPIPTGTP